MYSYKDATFNWVGYICNEGIGVKFAIIHKSLPNEKTTGQIKTAVVVSFGSDEGTVEGSAQQHIAFTSFVTLFFFITPASPQLDTSITLPYESTNDMVNHCWRRAQFSQKD